jgi:hypothetical protein
MKECGTIRGWMVLLAWLGLLSVGLLAFHALGDGPLTAPPMEPSMWPGWAADRDAAVATAAILRLVVLALAWYLLGVTGVGLLTRAARSVRAIRIADALTVPAVRRLLQATVGLSLATGVVASTLPAGSPAAAAVPAAVVSAGDGALLGDPELGAGVDVAARELMPHAVGVVPVALRVAGRGRASEQSEDVVSSKRVPPPLRRLDGGGPPGLAASTGGVSAESAEREASTTGREVVLRHLRQGDDAAAEQAESAGAEHQPEVNSTGTGTVGIDDDDPLLPPPTRIAGGPARPSGPASPPTDGSGSTPHDTTDQARQAPAAEMDAVGRVHVVVAGESLWTIAHDVVAVQLGRLPSDAEVAAYWLELIERQRPHLTYPDDPDLIFPGELVLLPVPTGGWTR